VDCGPHGRTHEMQLNHHIIMELDDTPTLLWGFCSTVYVRRREKYCFVSSWFYHRILMESNDLCLVKPNKTFVNQMHIFIKKIHVYAHSAVVLFLMYRLGLETVLVV